MDELFRVTLAELEIRQRQAMQLREALLPLLDEIGTGGDLDYHLRTDGHAERLQAALSTPADDWLERHDEEVRGEMLGYILDALPQLVEWGQPRENLGVADVNAIIRRTLQKARAQERERCLTRRYPIPFRAIEAVLLEYLPSQADRTVREWLDNISAAIGEADDAD